MRFYLRLKSEKSVVKVEEGKRSRYGQRKFLEMRDGISC